ALPARLISFHRASLVNVLVLGGFPGERTAIVRAFHEDSRLRRGPFVTVRAGIDSAQLAASLMAQLGLTSRRSFDSDLFSASEGGTLFLDDIERLPLETQRLLIEFLSHGRSEHAADSGWAGRLAAGSSKDLEVLSACGEFHEPLLDALDKIRID